jgi:hypothetical protein
MTADPRPIDISNIPDLLRITKEVEISKKPLKLTRDRKTVAILMPVSTADTPRKKPRKTRSDYEAFLASAGSWKDVDTDTLIKNIYEGRKLGSRPQIKL